MMMAVGLQSGARNFGMFVAARICIGFGDTIVLGAAPLLIAEIAHPQDRAVLVTLSGASYHSGAFIASWVTYGTLKIQAICTIVILFGIWFMPESPRWLMNKDRHEEALRVFSHYHGEDNEMDEFVQLEYAEVKAAIELDKASGQTNWVDFLKTKGNRKRTGIITAIGFFSQWSGNGLISYYLKYVMDNVWITDPQIQLGINGGMKTQGLVFNIGLAFFIDKLGRRPMYLVSTIGTFVVFNIWTIISARYEIELQKGLGYAFVVAIFFYGMFYDFKSGLMANYTTEILPYGLRAKDFTWLNFCYINTIALDALAWKFYLFYCVFLAFEVVIIYYYIVETRYTPMEEIAKYFNGDDAVDVADVAVADMKERGIELGDAGDKGASVTRVEVVR
ncbi:general substrate transporter [Clohesyomyces aquaticus]|uniref:General substrate transporter n=1 Tax=Clohesyomyces aquaticus TaxID=1231657 RepID=A0A1Y1ZAV1_9PLEO|nr:general substrate transporter [Clohesyomyces aquaticus]